MADFIYRQIEDRSDYYGPATYDLLTFHNSMFEREDDPSAWSYVPLTATLLPNETQVLPFVVGILPPSSFPSGRALDRSQNVAGPRYDDVVLDDPETTANQSTILPPWRGGTPKYVNPNLTPIAGQEAYDLFAQAWRNVFGTEPTEAAIRLMMAQWGNETAGGKGTKNYNFAGVTGVGPEGLTSTWQTTERYKTGSKEGVAAIERGYALGFEPVYTKSGEYFEIQEFRDFRAYTSAQLGANDYVKVLSLPRYKGIEEAAQAGDAEAYARILKQGGYYTASEDTYLSGLELYLKDIETGGYNTVGSQVRVEQLRARGLLKTEGPVQSDTTSGSSWATSGSKAASTAKEAEAKLASAVTKDIDLNATDIGKRYQTAQLNVVHALQSSIRQMASTPPLRLLLNPQSFKVASQKIVTDGNWGRNGAGVGIEHWGDDQDKISASGRIAGFYALDVVGPEGRNPAGPGLTRMARGFSSSYTNLMSLYLLYRNNGGVWLEDFADARSAQTSKPNNLAVLGSVYIYYDSTLYVGSFDSFEISEDDTAPFTLSYSFEFTVRATYLLDRLYGTDPNPAREFNLGGFFATASTIPTTTTVTSPTAPTTTGSGSPVPMPPGTTVTDAGRGYYYTPLTPAEELIGPLSTPSLSTSSEAGIIPLDTTNLLRPR